MISSVLWRRSAARVAHVAVDGADGLGVEEGAPALGHGREVEVVDRLGEVPVDGRGHVEELPLGRERGAALGQLLAEQLEPQRACKRQPLLDLLGFKHRNQVAEDRHGRERGIGVNVGVERGKHAVEYAALIGAECAWHELLAAVGRGSRLAEAVARVDR